MASPFCPVCEEDVGSLGHPSHARWVGPDGNVYCTLHFIARFGHAEKLVPISGYEPPAEVKPPAPKQEKPKRKRTRSTPQKEEVLDG